MTIAYKPNQFVTFRKVNITDEFMQLLILPITPLLSSIGQDVPLHALIEVGAESVRRYGLGTRSSPVATYLASVDHGLYHPKSFRGRACGA